MLGLLNAMFADLINRDFNYSSGYLERYSLFSLSSSFASDTHCFPRTVRPLTDKRDSSVARDDLDFPEFSRTIIYRGTSVTRDRLEHSLRNRTLSHALWRGNAP